MVDYKGRVRNVAVENQGSEELETEAGNLDTVEAGHLGRPGQQRLRFGQDHLATAFEVAEQAVTIGGTDVLLRLQQRARRRQCLGVALFLAV